MGKYTISMAIFNSFLYVYLRVAKIGHQISDFMAVKMASHGEHPTAVNLHKSKPAIKLLNHSVHDLLK